MNEIERKARELLGAELDAMRFPAMAAEVRDESGYNSLGQAMVRAVAAAITPDKTMVEMPGLGFSMPRWVLQSALDIGAYMDDRHPGDWKLGPIQKRG